MSLIIGLNESDQIAVRSLTANTSFSKAGLAVNATTNTYTLTLGGSKQTDDIINVSVSVNGATPVVATYTVLVGDANVDAIATALEVQIEALTGVNSSVVGSVVTIIPATATDAIVVTAAVTKAVGTPTLTQAVAQTILGAKGYRVNPPNTTLFFGVDGHAGSQTATANLALTGITPIQASSFRWYLVTINTSGTFTATPGPIDGKNILPDIPANQAVVGAIKIATAAATVFIPNTTSLNATGITDTYFDLSVVPTAGYPVA